jgi:hypothetical protein
VSLVYFEAPSSLMVQAVAQHQYSPAPGILGFAAIIVGVALLFAGRPRSQVKMNDIRVGTSAFTAR